MSQDPGQKYLNSGTNFTPTIHHDVYPAIEPSKANLSGKNIFVTGASKGVGRATAIAYAKAGALGIALGARSPLDSLVEEVKFVAKEAGHPEPKVVALRLDITDRQNVESAAHEISEAFDGRLDILINNAGFLSIAAPLMETDPDEWWRDYNVNVRGSYLVTRAFFPLLLRSSHKVVLNLTSIGAHILVPGSTAYSVAKLAILRFTEFLNQDHGPKAKDGLVVVGVHPGGVMTELARGLPEYLHVNLVDTPELAAGAMVWLGTERKEWLSGRYFNVTWDVKELEDRKEDIVKADLLKVRMAVNLFT